MILNYKGYTCSLTIDKNNIIGKVVGIQKQIVFHTPYIIEVQNEFEKSIDNYLKECFSENKEPEKPNLPFSLVNEFDAQIWAGEFCKKFKGANEDIILIWFSNAIMAGYDKGVEDGKNLYI